MGEFDAKVWEIIEYQAFCFRDMENAVKGQQKKKSAYLFRQVPFHPEDATFGCPAHFLKDHMMKLLFFTTLLLYTLQLEAQWKQVLENDGGPLNARTLARTPDGVMWLGTDNGLFTSADDGGTWAKHPSMPSNWKVKKIISSGNEMLVFAIQRLAPTTIRAWLKKSAGAGSTWSDMAINVPQQANPESMFTAVFKSDSTLFVQFGDGLFKSEDGGVTWSLALGGSLLIQCSAGGDSIIAAAYRTSNNGYFQLYLSSDNGETWQVKTLPGQTSFSHVRGVLVHKNRILAALSNRKIAVSTDWGATWAGQDLPASVPYPGYSLDAPSLRWDDVLDRPVAAFWNQYYSSPDGGLTWLPETTEPIYTGFDFLPEGNKLSASGTFGFATRTTAGSLPAPSNKGIFASTPTLVKTLGNEVYAGFNNTLFRSVDAGENWSQFNIPLLQQPGVMPVRDVEKSGDTLFLLTLEGLLVSTDNGATWPASYTKIIDGYKLMFGFPGELWIRRDYTNVTVVNRHNPAQTLRNFGCYPNNPSDQGADYLVLPDSNLILAPGFSYGNLYASSDSGDTWVKRSAFPNGAKPWRLIRLSTGRLIAYGLIPPPSYSDDQGLTWTSSTLNPSGITGIWQITETPDGLFAATNSHGLLKSDNLGQSWYYPPNNAFGGNFELIAYTPEMIGGVPMTRLCLGAVDKGVWKYNPSAPADFVLNGPALVCPGNIESYCVPAAPGNTPFYTWTGPPASQLNGQGNMLLLNNPGDECVDMDFGQTPGYVTVTRDAADYPASQTATKYVGYQYLSPTILPTLTIAYEDLPFNSPLTGAPVQNYPGAYNFTAGPFDSQIGCDSFVKQTVQVNPPVSGTVLGRVYWDYNNNGVFNNGVDVLAGGVIVTGSSGVFATSSPTIQYNLPGLQPGDTIRAVPPAPGVVVAPAFYIYQSGQWANYHFRLYVPLPEYNLTADATNLSVFRPGFSTNVQVAVRNIGLQSAQNAQVKLTIPPFIDVINALPAPDFVQNDTLTWTIGDLAYDSVFQIDVLIYTPVATAVGSEVNMQVIALPVSDDGNPGNNFYTLKNKVVAAFDPNDKQVDPAYMTPFLLKNGKPLEYTIRFQNTGNYPADFVKVIDTLTNTVDPASFRFVASSHPCTWKIRGQGVIEFLFDPITLPDSASNEPGSHGFVKFTVKPKENLPLGTLVENFCDIYFDFNDPVRTNTAGTQVVYFIPGEGLSINNKLLRVRPNPAAFHITCDWKQATPEDGRIRLFDLTGLPQLEVPVTAGDQHLSIDIQSLPPGLYFVLLEAGDLLLTAKVVVVEPDITGTGF